MILPFGMMCLLLFCAGVFREFWFWTVDYAQQYGTLVRLGEVSHVFVGVHEEAMERTGQYGHSRQAGTVAGLWNEGLRAGTLFCLGFLFFSALAVCPGLYFRHHYFIFVLPAVALLAGTGISALSSAVA